MRTFRLAIIACVLAVGAAACSNPPPSGGGSEGTADSETTGFEQVFAAVKGLTGKARTDKLVELANKEGQLNLYTSMTSDVADEFASDFDDAFGIEPNVYRADSETVLARLIDEANAGFQGSDIVETNGTELANLNQEGILVNADVPETKDLVSNSVYDGWIADRFNKFVISWNTDDVSAADAPKSWEDLADPKWDGKVSLEPTDVDWYKTLWEYWVNQKGMSPDEADKLFEQMADGGLFTKGHTLIGELLTAGEFSVAASNYSYIVQNAKEEGAPVEWQPPVEPIIVRPNGIGLVRGAEHPATALLFMEWVLGDGQEPLVDFNLDPARKDLATAKGSQEIFVDLGDYIENQKEWTDRYEQLVSRGKIIEEEG